MAYVKSGSLLISSAGINLFGSDPTIAAIASGPHAGGYVVLSTSTRYVSEAITGMEYIAFQAIPIITHYFTTEHRVTLVGGDGRVVDLSSDPTSLQYVQRLPSTGQGPEGNTGATSGVPVVHADGSLTVIFNGVGWGFPDEFGNPESRVGYINFNAAGEVSAGPLALTPGQSAAGSLSIYGSYGSSATILSNGEIMTSLTRSGYDGALADTRDNIQLSINLGFANRTNPVDSGTVNRADIAGAHLQFTNEEKRYTSVEAFGAGAVVVWNDGLADPTDSSGDPSLDGVGVLGALVDAAGNVVASFRVNQASAGVQLIVSERSIAALGPDKFAVVWESRDISSGFSPSLPSVFVRIFSVDGAAVSAVTGDIALGMPGDGMDRSRPSVTALADGGFVVVYERETDGFRNEDDSIVAGVAVQQFDRDGSFVGNEVVLRTRDDAPASGLWLNPTVTQLSDGRVAVAAEVYNAETFAYETGVQVLELNQNPTDITIDNNTFTEDQSGASWILIGALGTTDGNLFDRFTYELLNNPGNLFQIVGSQLYAVGHTESGDTHYEPGQSWELQIRSTDSAGVSVERTLTVGVPLPPDVTPPLDISVATAFADGRIQVDENAEAGSVIASIGAFDPDTPFDGLTFEIVGSDGRFALEKSTSGDFFLLIANGPFDYETAPFHDITLKVSDSNGSRVETFTVLVKDEAETPTTPVDPNPPTPVPPAIFGVRGPGGTIQPLTNLDDLKQGEIVFDWTPSVSQAIAQLLFTDTNNPSWIMAPIVTQALASGDWGASLAALFGNGQYSVLMQQFLSGDTTLENPIDVATALANFTVNLETLQLLAASGGSSLGLGAGESTTGGNWIHLNTTSSTLPNGTLIAYATDGDGNMLARDGSITTSIEAAALGRIGLVASDNGVTFFSGEQSIYLPVGRELGFAIVTGNGVIDANPTVNITGSDGMLDVAVSGNFGRINLTAQVDNTLSESATLASSQRLTDQAWVYLTKGTSVGVDLAWSGSYVNTLHFVRMEIDPTDPAQWQVGGVDYGNTSGFRGAVQANWEAFSTTQGNSTGTASSVWTVQGESGYYAPVLVTPDGMWTIDSSPGNTANGDGRQHIRNFGESVFGFEDMSASRGADFDYNDMIMKLTVL
jgi:hypothetical protein